MFSAQDKFSGFFKGADFVGPIRCPRADFLAGNGVISPGDPGDRVLGNDFFVGNRKPAGLVSIFALAVRRKKIPRIFQCGAFLDMRKVGEVFTQSD
jgi:hypothetical protein